MKFFLYVVKFNRPVIKLPERDLIVLSPEILYIPEDIFLSTQGTKLILYSLSFFGETVKFFFFED
jgi:hypothetical protein